MKDRIVVIGSSNIDMIMKMERLPRLGETITDGAFIQTFGGKGANQAVGAARAGGKVSFINAVGDCSNTDLMLNNFTEDQIDITGVFKCKGLQTGHALVMIGEAGSNYLSVAPGANYALTPEKIDSVSHLMDEAALIILQYEIPPETIKYVINLAEKKKIEVLWNFAPARNFDRSYFAKVGILVLNEAEAEFLTDIKVYDRQSAREAAEKCRLLGSKLVIITLGEKGSLTLSDNLTLYVPAFKVDAVDSTAAGDVFCGSLATALVEQQTTEQAVKFASAASALTVTKLGAQPSIPSRAEIEDFLLKKEYARNERN